MYRTLTRRKASIAAAVLLSSVFTFSAVAAGPEVVSGPSNDAKCFVPWSDKTKFFKFPKKEGPYRIALANGFIGNTWRIQMIKTAKAYAEQPDVKA
jgi:ribose transport system substrate-binding protein